jgi:hypothetical protein
MSKILGEVVLLALEVVVVLEVCTGAVMGVETDS